MLCSKFHCRKGFDVGGLSCWESMEPRDPDCCTLLDCQTILFLSFTHFWGLNLPGAVPAIVLMNIWRDAGPGLKCASPPRLLAGNRDNAGYAVAPGVQQALHRPGQLLLLHQPTVRRPARNPEPGTRNPKPETRNPQPETPMQPTPYTLHPTPYTLHPTPYTLHPTPCTLTLHPTPYTLHPTPYTLGSRVEG